MYYLTCHMLRYYMYYVTCWDVTCFILHVTCWDVTCITLHVKCWDITCITYMYVCLLQGDITCIAYMSHVETLHVLYYMLHVETLLLLPFMSHVERLHYMLHIGTLHVLHYIYLYLLQGENPIYKQATSTFVNPTYRKWGSHPREDPNQDPDSDQFKGMSHAKQITNKQRKNKQQKQTDLNHKIIPAEGRKPDFLKEILIFWQFCWLSRIRKFYEWQNV